MSCDQPVPPAPNPLGVEANIPWRCQRCGVGLYYDSEGWHHYANGEVR